MGSTISSGMAEYYCGSIGMKLHASLSHRIGLITATAFMVTGCDFIIAPPDGRPPSVSAAELRRKTLQDLHSSGALEGPTPLPTDFYQGECGSYFNKVAPKTAKGGVSISTQFMIQGTILVFNVSTTHLKSIQYKINQQQAFSDTGPGLVQDPHTGQPVPSTFVTLPPDLDANQRHTITVRWTDSGNKVHGPVELELDLPYEAVRAEKLRMEGPLAHNWVAFRDYFDSRLLYFTAVLSAKKALCEIRYSFDEPTLDGGLNYVPSTNLLQGGPIHQADQLYIDVPPGAQVVYVQLTYIDGTKSPIRKFDRRFART